MPCFATGQPEDYLQDNGRREGLLHHNLADYQQPNDVCLPGLGD